MKTAKTPNSNGSLPTALRLNWSRLLREWPTRRGVKVRLPEGWSEYWGL